MFLDRQDAALELADRMHGRKLRRPLVLAIPRGGLIIGAALAPVLHAELDVILAAKLRSPWNPEKPIGAVSEDQTYYLLEDTADVPGLSEEYVAEEVRKQYGELRQRQRAYRGTRARHPVEQRSVVLTDDGIATGATMIAALRTLKDWKPFEIIVAVPVAAADQIDRVRRWCDEFVYLSKTPPGQPVGGSYAHFPEVSDAEAAAMLHSLCPVQGPAEWQRSLGPVAIRPDRLSGETPGPR